MKKNTFFIALALVAMSMTSCQTEETLTPSTTFNPEATGDNPNPGTGSGGGTTGGTGGGTGITIPSDFSASTDASTRVAILEDFTGVRCGFCPQGHVIAEDIENVLGDEFIVIALHASGSYSSPSAGWPNFESPYGAAIMAQAGVRGFPAGTMNRLPAKDMNLAPQDTAKPNSMALGRGSWSSAANNVIGKTAPVNVGVLTSLSGRDLTVTVDLYYTENETETNHINVAILQSGLVGRQAGASNQNTYIQNHVLRTLIAGSNPQWGDPVTESTTKDAFVRKVYTYTIPADYNGTGNEGGGAAVLSNMEVVAFVTRGQTNILNAAITPIQ